MLEVIFGRGNFSNEEIIFDSDGYFTKNRESAWFEDPFIKNILKCVDGNRFSNEGVLLSKYGKYGQPIYEECISTGCKTLCNIYYNTENRVFNGSTMGNNCVPFLIEIAKEKPVKIFLEHFMFISSEYFETGLISSGGNPIKSFSEYLYLYNNWRYKQDSESSSELFSGLLDESLLSVLEEEDLDSFLDDAIDEVFDEEFDDVLDGDFDEGIDEDILDALIDEAVDEVFDEEFESDLDALIDEAIDEVLEEDSEKDIDEIIEKALEEEKGVLGLVDEIIFKAKEIKEDVSRFASNSCKLESIVDNFVNSLSDYKSLIIKEGIAPVEKRILKLHKPLREPLNYTVNFQSNNGTEYSIFLNGKYTRISNKDSGFGASLFYDYICKGLVTNEIKVNISVPNIKFTLASPYTLDSVLELQDKHIILLDGADMLDDEMLNKISESKHIFILISRAELFRESHPLLYSVVAKEEKSDIVFNIARSEDLLM